MEGHPALADKVECPAFSECEESTYLGVCYAQDYFQAVSAIHAPDLHSFSPLSSQLCKYGTGVQTSSKLAVVMTQESQSV